MTVAGKTALYEKSIRWYQPGNIVAKSTFSELLWSFLGEEIATAVMSQNATTD